MSRRRSEDLGTIDTINVTPLVDLTFLLLIVFMITAPILEYTVDVSAPQLTAQRTEGELVHRIVSVDAEGLIYYGETRVTLGELGETLRTLIVSEPQVQVFIRADESRSYGEIVGVLRTVKHAGVSNFKLVTREEGPL